MNYSHICLIEQKIPPPELEGEEGAIYLNKTWMQLNTERLFKKKTLNIHNIASLFQLQKMKIGLILYFAATTTLLLVGVIPISDLKNTEMKIAWNINIC